MSDEASPCGRPIPTVSACIFSTRAATPCALLSLCAVHKQVLEDIASSALISSDRSCGLTFNLAAVMRT